MLQSCTGRRAGTRAARSARRTATARAAYAGTMPGQPHPFDQSSYQVRLEWGVDGLAGSRPSDIVVVVDVLRFSSTVIPGPRARRGVRAGCRCPRRLDQRRRSGRGRRCDLRRRHARRTAQRGGSRRGGAGGAEGARRSHECGSHRLRRARLARGGVAAAVRGRGPARRRGDRGGADRSRNRSLVARGRGGGEAFRALRGATRHLLAASGSGRELSGAGRSDEVTAAAAVDAASVVPVLRDGVFEVC